jgi:cell division protein FtsB
MSASGEIRRRARHVAGPALVAALIGYFGFHAVQGEHGLIAWWRIAQQIERTQAALDETRGEREALERRVTLLRPESLDPDMLEERARIMLNLAHPDEVIILDAGAEVPTGATEGEPGRGSGGESGRRWFGEIR